MPITVTISQCPSHDRVVGLYFPALNIAGIVSVSRILRQLCETRLGY